MMATILANLSYLFLLSLYLLLVPSNGSKILISGKDYTIFQPFPYDQSSSGPSDTVGLSLLSPPHVWIKYYEQQLDELQQLVEFDDSVNNSTTYAQEMYIQALSNYLVGDYLGSYERTIDPKVNYVGRLKALPFDSARRDTGYDFPMFGITMTGRQRLSSLKTVLIDIITNNIPGDVVETGVWRGGMSIFMRGILLAYRQGYRRSYVCDSFAGLPPSQMKQDTNLKWDHSAYLEVSEKQVARNFVSAGISDSRIIFTKGLFINTMKPLSQMITSLAILRLDGDMYESTVDVLYHLYDKLSIGGYVIIDDYATRFPARTAVDDFITVHKMSPEIIQPDECSGYWKKTKQITIQYWRYQQKKFKA